MPSLNALEDKKKIVNEIKDKIGNAKTLVLFDYRGLTDATIKNLRKELRNNGSEYKIYKNTLLSLAFNDLNIDLNEYLEGPTAVAFSNDDVAAIKVLDEVSKDNKDLVLKVGIVEGNIADSDKLKEFAKIPDRQGLYTMLAGGMIEITRNLAIALNLYSEQKEGSQEEKVVETVEEKAEVIEEVAEEPVVEETAETEEPVEQATDDVASLSTSEETTTEE